MFDKASGGSPIKWLSVVEEHTLKYLGLKCDRSITSEDVIDTLGELFAMGGVPINIRSDNGRKFEAIRRRLEQLNIRDLCFEPRSPWESGDAESFHSRLRGEFLELEEFESLAAARKLTTS